MERPYKIPVPAPYRITSDARGHREREGCTLCGIDYATLTGNATMLAMHAGRVEYVHDYGTDPNNYDTLGRFFVIAGLAGAIRIYSRYCHSARVDVVAGQTVGAGDPVAVVGSTGLSTGPHLHLDHWIAPEDVDEGKQIGLVPFYPELARAPWPGGPVLCNVDPTAFLTARGLDVVKTS